MRLEVSEALLVLAGGSLCGLDGCRVSGLIQYGILATYLIGLATLVRLLGLVGGSGGHDCFKFFLSVFEVGMARKKVMLKGEEERKGEEKERGE